MKYLATVFLRLLPTVPLTLLLVALSFVIGFFFAILIAWMKLSKVWLFSLIANAYITFIRCTPPVIILFLSFFGLSLALAAIGIHVGETNSGAYAVFTLTLLAAGTMAEMMRAAYQAVNPGQYAAAVSVGLTPFQAFLKVVAPQALRIALPNFGNMLTALLHESSLAYLIGVIDVLGRANILSMSTFGSKSVVIYFAVTLIYWALSSIIGKGIDLLVARYDRAFDHVTARA
jgi:L-cystine transport system permease protein